MARPTRCSATLSSAPATTATATPASAARAAVPTPGSGGGLGDLFDAFFGGGQSVRRWRGAGRADRPRGQDIEVVADLTFEQAVFGAADPGVAAHCHSAATTARAVVPASRTKPVTCSECNGTGQVRRVRQSLLGQMVTVEPVPALRRPRASDRHPVPDLWGRRARHRRQAPTRSTCRPASTPAPRCGSPDGARPGRVRRPGRRPLRARPGRRRTTATAATATISSPRCRSRSPRRRSVRGSRCDARR